MELTQEQLEGWCSRWQKLLRLQDWIVKIQLKRSFDMAIDGVAGTCTNTLSTKTAVIEVLDPNDFPSRPTWEPDSQHTVVHELLHLHFAPFMSEDRRSLEAISQEQAIDLIASAFIELDRSRKA